VASPSSSPVHAIAQYGLNLPARESFAKKLAEAMSAGVESPLDISSDDGPHVSPDKAHKLSAEVHEEIGWESPNEWDFQNVTLAQRCKKLKVVCPFIGVAKKLDLAAEAAVGIPVSKGKHSVVVTTQLSPSKTPSKTSKFGSASSIITSSTPTFSARCKSRNKAQDSESMLAKVVRLQKSKDNPGNPLPLYDFVLLSSLPDDHLLEVALDSGLALVPGVGSCVDLLSLVRAKEIAQAALAQDQVKFAEQKAAEDAAAAADAQVATAGPSVPPSVASADLRPQPQVPVPPVEKCSKLLRSKSSKQPKQVSVRVLRKTPARQARVSLRVSK
jgi:hypothetical protein